MIRADVIFTSALDVILIIPLSASLLFCNPFPIKCVSKTLKKTWEVPFVPGVNNESLIHNTLLWRNFEYRISNSKAALSWIWIVSAVKAFSNKQSMIFAFKLSLNFKAVRLKIIPDSNIPNDCSLLGGTWKLMPWWQDTRGLKYTPSIVTLLFM